MKPTYRRILFTVLLFAASGYFLYTGFSILFK